MAAPLPASRLATWADVDRWSDTLAERIRSAGRAPEAIVALTRGGWVPARLLADRLGIQRLHALRANHWGVTATPTGKAELGEGFNGSVRGEEVLLLDDITDTGESLELARAHVVGLGPSRVVSATYLHITHSKFVPDFYAEEIPRERWVWIVFPWNYWEDLSTLARRASEVAPAPAAVRATLATRCGLAVPLEHVERALASAPR